MVIPADLQGIGYPIPFLQILVEHVRAGLLAASGIPTKKRLVQQYIRSTGKIFAAVGASDQRNNKLGKIDFWLDRQLTTYAKQKPPQTRVRPIPVSVLQELNYAYQGGTAYQQAISNLAWIAYLFLLSPGDYCRGGADTAHHFFLL